METRDGLQTSSSVPSPHGSLLIVGDIHGCAHSFEALLARHYNPERDLLVQLGDLVDRGRHTPQTVALARNLEARHSAVFLLGNHEYEMSQHFVGQTVMDWFGHCGDETLRQYARTGRDCLDDVQWFSTMPLRWESELLLLTHAGVAADTDDPYQPRDLGGVLWNRERAGDVGKLQVHGHRPRHAGPLFDRTAQAWNIDTGACYGRQLSALRLDRKGYMLEVVSVPTDPRDVDGQWAGRG
jgi:serine/threonine protein phosphatase 1